LKSAITRLVALAALLGIAALALGCSASRPAAPGPAPAQAPTSQPATAPPPAALPATAPPPATSLGTVEVRRYKGKRLDAVKTEPETSIAGPQHVDIKRYRLAVGGLVKSPLSLTYAQVLALPAYRKATTLHCIDGWSRTYLWQGVLLKDLLGKAGFDAGARTVIFRCYDGYSTSLPLSEVVSKNMLLAYGMNGRVMAPARGYPFQVVAEDHYGYKWAKWVTSIEVSNDIRFRGHFEKMGADNTGTITPSK